jgi:prevent-host-death family protein
VHVVHMKTISIRDLHLNTGEWIRKVSSEQKIVITERGEPVATLIPFERAHTATPFANRKLVPGFENLPPTQHDSTESISTDRDRA